MVWECFYLHSDLCGAFDDVSEHDTDGFTLGADTGTAFAEWECAANPALVGAAAYLVIGALREYRLTLTPTPLPQGEGLKNNMF